MAISNIEIEIKIRLEEKDFLQFRKKISEIAKFIKKSNHVDEYFVPPSRNFLEPEYPFEWLSIRKRDGKTLLNYKHYYPEFAEFHTHADEFETEIKDEIQLKKIFDSLNFKSIATVEKEREVYNYNDEFEIELDFVKDLGNFVEIEAKKDFGSVTATRKRLLELARGFGLDVTKADKKGYPYLIMMKKGLLEK